MSKIFVCSLVSTVVPLNNQSFSVFQKFQFVCISAGAGATAGT